MASKKNNAWEKVWKQALWIGGAFLSILWKKEMLGNIIFEMQPLQTKLHSSGSTEMLNE